MTEILIDKKKYVLVPKQDYEALQKKQPKKQNQKNFSQLKMPVC